MLKYKLTFALPALLVLLLGCGGDGGSIGNDDIDHTVSMAGDDRFTPRTLVVQPGDVIRWRNDDADPHTVESDTGAAGLDSDAVSPNGLAAGQRFDFKVPISAAIGTRYFYHCRFHGTPGNGTDFGTGMVGVIQVGEVQPQTINVGMTSSVFTPRSVTVRPGDTVWWTNVSDLLHTVTADLDTPGLDSSTSFPGGMSTGDVFTWTVPESAGSGTRFFYHCQFHGGAGDGTAFGDGMSGVVEVE